MEIGVVAVVIVVVVVVVLVTVGVGVMEVSCLVDGLKMMKISFTL